MSPTLLRRPWLRVFWLELLLVMAWVGFLVHSQVRSIARDSDQPEGGLELLTAAGEGPGAEWLAVYLQGQKIGCGLSDRVPLADGFRLQERTYLRLRAFEQDREITTVFVARIDQRQRLKSFTFLLNAPPSRIDVQGEVVGRNLSLQINSGGQVQEQVVPLEEPPEISLTFKDRLLGTKPKVGDALEFPYFDPATLSKQRMKLTVVKTGEAEVNGLKVPTVTLEASYQGFKTTSVVTLDGRTLEETNALGMSVRRESREKAIYEGWENGKPPVDLIALSAVSVSAPLPNARALTALDARLTGGGVEVLLRSLRDDGKPGEVQVRIPPRDTWKPYQIPMIDQRFAASLKATSLVQKDDPKIVSVAQSVVGDSLRADDAVARLNAWVHDRLTKTPVMGIPSALDILKTGKGDCNEHTTLFTALARAVGIPTRMAAGVVYSEEITGSPAFYYHAWPEVYLGQWVPVDPTFGQYPADATHIKLVEGDLSDQLALLRVVGNLHVEVVSYKE